MKKALTGALIGFLAGALLTFVVMTARFCHDDNPLDHAMILACICTPFGALHGLVMGAVIGAVIGFFVRGTPANATPARRQKGGYSCGDMLRQRKGQAKCPFCHSTTFRVDHDARLRRCGDCRSVLPNYIQGNRYLAGRI